MHTIRRNGVRGDNYFGSDNKCFDRNIDMKLSALGKYDRETDRQIIQESEG